jgi:hypothetical protein
VNLSVDGSVGAFCGTVVAPVLIRCHSRHDLSLMRCLKQLTDLLVTVEKNNVLITLVTGGVGTNLPGRIGVSVLLTDLSSSDLSSYGVSFVSIAVFSIDQVVVRELFDVWTSAIAPEAADSCRECSGRRIYMEVGSLPLWHRW